MKRIFLKLVLLAGFLMCLSLNVPAQAKTLFGDYLKEKKIDATVSGTADFYSKYIWRGMRLDNDAVFQPGFTIASNGFAVNVWGNFDLYRKDTLASNEVDTTASYTRTFENVKIGDFSLAPVTVTGGNIYYAFPETNAFTSEVFVGVTYGCFLSPGIAYYYDYIDEKQGGGDGSYLLLSLAQSFPLSNDYGITFDVSGHVGFNSGDYIRGEGGDYLAKAGFTIPLTDNLKVSPSVNYSVPFGDLKSSSDGNQKQFLYYGASLAYNF